VVVVWLATTTRREISMAIVTTTLLREYLDQVKAGTAIDAALERILARAESIVVDALGFTFFDDGVAWDDIAATTKRLRSEQSKYLRLPPYEIGSIERVAVMSGTTITTTTVDGADYEETGERFYLYRPDGWGGVRYAVTAKYGYGPAPGSIVELILELAVNIWRQRGQGLFQSGQGVDAANNAVGGGFLKYVGGLNADQRKIIANVRRQYVEAVH
jgi:hypothetical protein